MNNTYMPKKAKVSKPAKTYKHRLANFHQTSTAFMQSVVLFKKQMKANSSLNIKYDAFVRLEEMPKPTMGLANMKLNWFYVPNRCVMANYNEFKGQSLTHGSKGVGYVTKLSYFRIDEVLHYMFTSNNTNNLFIIQGRIDQDAPNPYTGTDFDMTYTYRGETYALKYTYKGFCMLNLYHQLGYIFPTWDIHNSISSQNYPRAYKSAIPLLSYAKIILDYYLPSQWQDMEITYNEIYQYLNSTDTEIKIHADVVYKCLELVFYVAYENDITTEAWNNPAGPNVGSLNYDMIDNVDDTADSVINSYSGVATLVPDAGEITQLALNRLLAMDKILKKNQVVGTKYWDRLMARFGIKTNKALIRIPEILETLEVPIILNEVVATAETAGNNSGANLGALAGRGEAYIDKEAKFNYFAEEDGMLFCIATIVPEIGYSNYEDEECDAIEALDVYNDEYDATGTQPIMRRNVINPEWSGELYFNTYWGFLPMYYWMKVSRSRVSGKYAVASWKDEMRQWTFNRYTYGIFNNSQVVMPANNNLDWGIGTDFTAIGFNMYPTTQFDYIFYTPMQHNFNIFFTWDILMQNTMKPLWDYGLFDDEEDEKEYTINLNPHE